MSVFDFSKNKWTKKKGKEMTADKNVNNTLEAVKEA